MTNRPDTCYYWNLMSGSLRILFVASALLASCGGSLVTGVELKVTPAMSHSALAIAIELFDSTGASLSRKFQSVETLGARMGTVPLDKPFSFGATAVDSSGIELGRLSVDGIVLSSSDKVYVLPDPLGLAAGMGACALTVGGINPWRPFDLSTAAVKLETCLVGSSTGQVYERRCATDTRGELAAFTTPNSRFGGFMLPLPEDVELRWVATDAAGATSMTWTSAVTCTAQVAKSATVRSDAVPANPCAGTRASTFVERGCN